MIKIEKNKSCKNLSIYRIQYLIMDIQSLIKIPIPRDVINLIMFYIYLLTGTTQTTRTTRTTQTTQIPDLIFTLPHPYRLLFFRIYLAEKSCNLHDIAHLILTVFARNQQKIALEIIDCMFDNTVASEYQSQIINDRVNSSTISIFNAFLAIKLNVSPIQN